MTTSLSSIQFYIFYTRTDRFARVFMRLVKNWRLSLRYKHQNIMKRKRDTNTFRQRRLPTKFTVLVLIVLNTISIWTTSAFSVITDVGTTSESYRKPGTWISQRQALEDLIAFQDKRWSRRIRDLHLSLQLFLEPSPDSHQSHESIQIEDPRDNYRETNTTETGTQPSIMNGKSPQLRESETLPGFGLSRPRLEEDASPTYQDVGPATNSTSMTLPIRGKLNVTLLLIDHYDSFTYNLYDMLAQCTIEPPIVLAKDALDAWPTTKANDTSALEWLDAIDGIILSPGPGTPYAQPKFSKQAITENPNLPILGVCLGHQLLASTYGATVDTAPIPIHGQTHDVLQTAPNNPLFENMPSLWKAMRYHSLAIQPDSLRNNKELQVTATTLDDRVIQGIVHTKFPHYGVQFHPESVGTGEFGKQLLSNFCNICYQHKLQRQSRDELEFEDDKGTEEKPQLEQETRKSACPDPARPSRPLQHNVQPDELSDRSRFRTYIYRIPNLVEADSSDASKDLLLTPEQVFQHFYEKESHSIWLDSSRAASSTARRADGDEDASSSTEGISGTISILAAPTRVAVAGSNEILQRRLVEYHCAPSYDSDDSGGGENLDILTWLQNQLGPPTEDVRVVRNINEHDECVYSADFALLMEKDFVSRVNDDSRLQQVKDNDGVVEIPFDYRGGYLGYLGYSVRQDTERYLQEQEHSISSPSKTTTANTNFVRRTSPHDWDMPKRDTPSAAFLLAERSMVFHHPTQQWYLVGLVDQSDSKPQQGDDLEHESELFHWMKQTCEEMERLQVHQALKVEKEKEFEKNFGTGILVNGEKSLNNDRSKHSPLGLSPIRFVPNRPRATYERNIAECQEQIRLGESYELCLTNQLEASLPAGLLHAQGGPLSLYRVLRRRNPAPYSAFFNWNLGSGMDDGFKNLSSTKKALVHPLESMASSSLAICCSSPERFISVGKRRQEHTQDTSRDDEEDTIILQAEAKPIKGTRARIMSKSMKTSSDAANCGRSSRTQEEEDLMPELHKSYEIPSKIVLRIT